MKRLISVIAGIALIGSLVGCGSATSATPEVKKVANASDVVKILKKDGLPIGELDVYSTDKDPNKLMGRPGQYTSKVNFKDTTVKEEGKSIEVVNGGSVEMFDNTDDAKNRFEYVSKIAKSAPMFNEYDYVNGKILVRVSRDLTPDQAKKYEDELKKIEQ